MILHTRASMEYQSQKIGTNDITMHERNASSSSSVLKTTTFSFKEKPKTLSLICMYANAFANIIKKHRPVDKSVLLCKMRMWVNIYY